MKKKFGILFFILFSVLFITQQDMTYAETVKIEGGEISGERTFVPFRAIFEEFGADVTWDQTAKTILAVRENDTIYLTIGSPNALVNGKNMTMDVAPYIKDGKTYVPLRFISESLGAEIDWNEKSRVATVVLDNKVIQVSTFHWNTYTNVRFGFAINYPSNWGLSLEPTNGDGMTFYSGIAGADFRTYGSYSNSVAPDYFSETFEWYFYPEYYDSYAKETKFVSLADGNIATVLIDRTGNYVTYHMLIVEDEVDYHFDAVVPNHFDEEMIWKMIESFRILDVDSY